MKTTLQQRNNQASLIFAAWLTALAIAIILVVKFANVVTLM